jgi:regulator of protease activity HflC (stomatin/prohibitin superfamily)
MLFLFLVMVVAFGVLGATTGEIWFPRFLMWLGQDNRWYSPVRQKPTPGTYNIMTWGIGAYAGSFASLIHNVLGYHYNKRLRQFYPGERVEAFTSPEKYLDGLGLVWIGFIKTYYRRDRRYEDYEFDVDKEMWKMVPKNITGENSHIFYFVTTMALGFVKLITKDSQLINLKVIWNTLNFSPIKSEFLAGKWEVRVNATVGDTVRRYVGEVTLDKLRTESDTPDENDLVDQLVDNNWALRGETSTRGLIEESGVSIDSPKIVEPDFDIHNKDILDARQRQTIAKEDVVTSRIRIEEEENKGKAEASREREAARGIREKYAARDSSPNGPAYTWADAVRTTSARSLFLSLGPEGKGGVWAASPDIDSGVGDQPNRSTAEE